MLQVDEYRVSGYKMIIKLGVHEVLYLVLIMIRELDE